eukprot:8143-Heterococcus_DN1.PRE.1
MGNGGVCKLLPRVIEAQINSCDIVHCACVTVQILANCHNNRVKLGKYNACEAVWRVANTKHISNETVAATVCNAMCNLALYHGRSMHGRSIRYNRDNNIYKLQEARACEAIPTIMQTHSNNTVVLLAALKVKSELSGREIAQHGLQINVINAMVQHLTTQMYSRLAAVYCILCPIYLVMCVSFW